jgi:hypothetical protein
MKYPSDAIGATVLIPKLLGSFELELHPIVREIATRSFSTIINVGCAEGYYSVGLALKLPEARVHAFELDPSFRHLCSKMAVLNEVAGRTSIHGAATSEELQVLVPDVGQVLVICDCEGCEIELFDPAIAPFLKTASILVELHDFVDQTISETLLSRFEGTHHMQIIQSSNRNPHEYDELNNLSEQDAALAVDEFRPERMQWAWMKPRRHASRLER